MVLVRDVSDPFDNGDPEFRPTRHLAEANAEEPPHAEGH
jgi:hypothetical protein